MKSLLNLSIKIEKPFGNLYRDNTALFVCKTAKGTYLLGEKTGFYPKGIVRFLGGGMEKGHANYLETAQTELEEEIQYRPKAEDLTEFGTVTISAEDKTGTTFNHSIHMFYTELPKSAQLKASDDVTGLAELSLDELKELITTYNNLPKDLWGKEGSLEYLWSDFAQVYGPVHQFAVEYIESIK
jgi:8-oxo-dGTP pyrophosphatase MutT (NUDIX family)